MSAKQRAGLSSTFRRRIVFCRKGTTIRDVPARIASGLPSVILGVLLNALDAASTGLLVFPSPQEGPAFANLQVEAMSLYIMSTITSQLAMTLGGSLFPGSLGSMLIEILPFLRGIASDIQGVLGKDSPKLLPTVLAAYELTSLLVGVCFLGLGLFRLGWLVGYLPHTVLTGVIGAIGISLFELSLQLTLPPTSSALLSKEHMPLLLASILPAAFLVVSLRLKSLAKLTGGFTEHAMYVPAFVFIVAAIFWVIVAAQGNADAKGMAKLASQGWLFTLKVSSSPATGSASWNYWRLFDFSMVQWSALNAAIQNIVLLVVIGVVNLPVFIPAMAIMLDEPQYSMNWELIGHGISNILAGATGSLPNLVVLANSRLFTFAGGGRAEALVVTGFTCVLFFTSAHVLPYVPTILASILVLFLGLDLITEALWSSAYELLWSEWAIVLGTVLACTFIGFLPGFAMGLGIALAVHLCWEFHDMTARSVTINLQNLLQVFYYPESSSTLLSDSEESSTSPACTQICNGESLTWGRTVDSVIPAGAEANNGFLQVISLSGNLFFATTPSLESQLDTAHEQGINRLTIVDLTNAHRAETCIGQLFKRHIAKNNSGDVFSDSRPPFVFVGLRPNSGLSADLSRGGLSCHWPQFSLGQRLNDTVLCYLDLHEAIRDLSSSIPSPLSGKMSDAEIFQEVDRFLCGVGLFLKPSLPPYQGHPISTVLKQGGALVHRIGDSESLGESMCPPSFILVIRGALQAKVNGSCIPLKPSQGPPAQRQPLFPAAKALLQDISSNLRQRCTCLFSGLQSHKLSPTEQSPLLQRPDAQSNGSEVLLFLGPWDSYLPSLIDPSNPDLGYSPVVFTSINGPCWAISIPIDQTHLLDQVFVLLERRRMNDRLAFDIRGV